MSPLELKRIQVELQKVEAARGDMELRIHERRDEIERLEGHIKIQLDKEAELKAKIEESKKQ